MNRRTVDLRDATRQDIVDVCSAIEQIFLFYQQGKTPSIYIINLLELLLQSARTRLCILRLSSEKKHYDFTAESIKKNVIVFANFRNRMFYNIFCKKLAEELNKNSAHFLSYELVKIPAKTEDLYFCLPRIRTSTYDVSIDHTQNPEAYNRIRQLLQTMYMERNFWCTDLLSEIYKCFSSIPANSNLNCPDTCEAGNFHPKEIELLPFIHKNTNAFLQSEDLMLPINEWVDYVYQHAAESRLTSVIHHADEKNTVDYSNIFFFLRINKPNSSPNTKNCDNFDVKIICPEQQRKELSLYYHRKQRHHCQWYDSGRCGIDGMPKCEFESIWNNLPENSQCWDEDTITEHYEQVWQGLEISEGRSKKTSEDAFRNNSVIFERYARQESADEETGYVRIDPKSKRDRLMACTRYRLLPDPKPNTPKEDQVPQVMFVPIYAGGAPFVMAATVVNAKRPESQKRQMSEWRSAYRFAGMVLQFMSSRLKEAARKAYLNTAADIMEEFAHRITRSVSQDIIQSSLEDANHQLAMLAQTYPYQKIRLHYDRMSLANSADLVNHKERQKIVIDNQMYTVSLQENHFWCHYSADKTFFTAKDVARKFKSAQGRVELIRKNLLAEEVKELYEQHFGKNNQQLR